MKNKNNEQVKALVLLSGGLDSILAAKLLMEQGIEVEGISFKSNFFDTKAAEKATKQLGIGLREIEISEEFLTLLKEKPKHGYGVGLNPCIDCHALMFRKAGEIMRAEGFGFIATGEVLNERPMSQNKQALKIVEKEAGLGGYLLRPLSAKLLEPTIAEKEGLVDREELMDISGRSRKKQFELAKKFGITDFPAPAGGCMLTQEGFVKRMKDLMERKKDFNSNDVELIKIGRHFWNDDYWIILGRDKEENEKLSRLKTENDMIIEPENFMGPSALIRFFSLSFRVERGISFKEQCKKYIEKAKELIIEYSPKAENVYNLKFIIHDK